MTETGADLEPTRIPTHVGLILDGNGRWAQQRGLPRTAGHAAGEAALLDVIEGAQELGIAWLTAYTFSTENWTRDPEEVEFLMFFNEDLLLRRRDHLHQQGMRLLFAGELDDPRIPAQNRRRMAETEELTAANTGMNMVFAFNYGGRPELVRAARRLAAAVVDGELAVEDIDAEALAARLAVADMPDADLIIRSSGEQRLSNFLLWHAAYAELIFSPKLWPDFTRVDLREAVIEFQHRARRFGRA